jgi:TonB-dependent starch-binding outer membrane protein SusC
MKASESLRLLVGATFVLALLVTVSDVGAAQQPGTIVGQVIDGRTHRPVAGVQIHLPGPRIGALTREDGRYIVPSVPAGRQVVRATIIGYATVDRAVEVGAGETVTVNFELAQRTIGLDEIVVTGAGQATERRRLGNSIAAIDMTPLETAPVANLSEILTGREPGVIGLPSSGLAGTGARIRIRGSASLVQTNEPIVYIDGVRVDRGAGMAPGVFSTSGDSGEGTPSRLDDLSPDAIERIEILKGAAAATLYGTQASNGVIQIFTKRGQAGAPRWNLRIEQGFSHFPDRFEPLAGFVVGQEPSSRPHGNDVGVTGVRERWGIDVQPYEVFTHNELNQLFETGHHQIYSLSVDGGTSAVTYYANLRRQMDDGPFGPNRGFQQPGFRLANDVHERTQGTANLMIFPRDNLRLRVSGMYIEGYNEAPSNNNNIFGVLSGAIMSRPELASEAPAGSFRGNYFGSPAFATTRELMHRRHLTELQRAAGSVSASYAATSSVDLEATFGVDFVNRHGATMIPFGWDVDGMTGSNVQGFRTVGDGNHRELSLDVKGTWNTEFGSDWTSSLLVGAQGFVSTSKNSGGTGQEFAGLGLDIAGAGRVQTVFETFLEEASTGVFVQEQLGFRNFLFLTGGLRYDEHSAFGETAGGAFYPKASVSVVPSDMERWRSDRISTLRFRSAIGQSGLQPGAFDKFTTFIPLAAETGPGVAPGNLGNEDLKPEISTEWEVGSEIGFFNDRASLDVTYWNRTVKDVLVDRQFAPSGGFRFRQLDNIGEMNAYGFDIGTRAIVASSPRMSLSVFANGAYLRERITDMGGAAAVKVGDAYPRYRQYTREGYAPGSFFGPVLQNVAYPFNLPASARTTTEVCQQPTEAELRAYLSQPRSPDVLPPLVEHCGTPDALLNYIGKPQPNWQGGFGANLSFLQNWELSTTFEYRAGDFYIHDLSGEFRNSHPLIGRNHARIAEVEATLVNPASSVDQRMAAAQQWVREFAGLTPFDGLNAIHKADFVRWRELSLTFHAPQRWASRVGAERLSLSAAGRNLHLWTRFPGVDPEISQSARTGTGGIDNNFQDGTVAWGHPIPRRVTFAVQVGF